MRFLFAMSQCMMGFAIHGGWAGSSKASMSSGFCGTLSAAAWKISEKATTRNIAALLMMFIDIASVFMPSPARCCKAFDGIANHGPPVRFCKALLSSL
jgi:hypothetical protein